MAVQTNNRLYRMGASDRSLRKRVFECVIGQLVTHLSQELKTANGQMGGSVIMQSTHPLSMFHEPCPLSYEA